MTKGTSGRLLTRSVKTLRRDLKSGELDPGDFLNRGLAELLEVVNRDIGEEKVFLEFQTYDAIFSEILLHIQRYFHNFETDAFEKEYDCIVQRVASVREMPANWNYLEGSIANDRISAIREAIRGGTLI